MHDRIKQLVNDLSLGSFKSYSWLGSGYVSHAYEIQTSDGVYVLLEKRGGVEGNVDYRYYYCVLKCLAKYDYKNAPRPIHVSPDGQTIIMTKSSGKELSKLNNLSPDDKEKVAKNLAAALVDLARIQESDFKEALSEFNLSENPRTNDEQAWQKYTLSIFNEYKHQATNKEVRDWLEDQINNFTPYKNKSESAFFIHGDPNGNNILVDDKLFVTLIDWSSAQFYVSDEGKQDYSLAYAINHNPLMHEMQQTVIGYVANKKGLDVKGFEELINYERKIIKIADIVWAFMMEIKALNNKAPDKPEVYRKVLKQRIKEYKQDF